MPYFIKEDCRTINNLHITMYLFFLLPTADRNKFHLCTCGQLFTAVNVLALGSSARGWYHSSVPLKNVGLNDSVITWYCSPVLSRQSNTFSFIAIPIWSANVAWSNQPAKRRRSTFQISMCEWTSARLFPSLIFCRAGYITSELMFARNVRFNIVKKLVNPESIYPCPCLLVRPAPWINNRQRRRLASSSPK